MFQCLIDSFSFSLWCWLFTNSPTFPLCIWWNRSTTSSRINLRIPVLVLSTCEVEICVYYKAAVATLVSLMDSDHSGDKRQWCARTYVQFSYWLWWWVIRALRIENFWIWREISVLYGVNRVFNRRVGTDSVVCGVKCVLETKWRAVVLCVVFVCVLIASFLTISHKFTVNLVTPNVNIF